MCLQCGRPGFDPWVRKIPWRRKWQPTPVLLPGESHGRRSLCDPTVHGVTKSRTWLHFHFTTLGFEISHGFWIITAAETKLLRRGTQEGEVKRIFPELCCFLMELTFVFPNLGWVFSWPCFASLCTENYGFDREPSLLEVYRCGAGPCLVSSCLRL